MFLLGLQTDVIKTEQSDTTEEDLIDEDLPKSVDWRTEVNHLIYLYFVWPCL